ncbi:DNA polymerase III subunit gamma/tau [Methylorubrum populi]|uniref:DNA polymerase III subunit gamma/tau n=1 Tax=Methylorubrum populi TaxID=223967 RepID=UPI000DB09513|nr:DNA polymerase III subunit gamma/tau [Methylorubrum populi]PZP68411.1 MAG: DNA polymerase III subunit gamma/tau [Methylorubrum populi]
MRVSLTLLRRIATSLMLLAVTALAVNVVAAPVNTFAAVERLEAAGPEHSHMHGDGTVHSHVVAKSVQDNGGWPPFPPLDDPQHHEHEKADCCGLAHPIALPPDASGATTTEAQGAALVPQESVLPFGVDPKGPRRPPRSLPNV